jgi:hypothetical protein
MQISNHPKGTLLNRRMEPAQEGETVAYRVENVKTPQGTVMCAVVPVVDGPVMRMNRSGTALEAVEV